jgi:hypothetical protein
MDIYNVPSAWMRTGFLSVHAVLEGVFDWGTSAPGPVVMLLFFYFQCKSKGRVVVTQTPSYVCIINAIKILC